MSNLDKLVGKDFEIGNMVIPLTGKFELIPHLHGVILETEEEVKEATFDNGPNLNLRPDVGVDSPFENYIIISIGMFYKEKK